MYKIHTSTNYCNIKNFILQFTSHMSSLYTYWCGKFLEYIASTTQCLFYRKPIKFGISTCFFNFHLFLFTIFSCGSPINFFQEWKDGKSENSSTCFSLNRKNFSLIPFKTWKVWTCISQRAPLKVQKKIKFNIERQNWNWLNIRLIDWHCKVENLQHFWKVIKNKF